MLDELGAPTKLNAGASNRLGIGLVRDLAIAKLEHAGDLLVSVEEGTHGHALRRAAVKVQVDQRIFRLIALLGSKVVIDQTPWINKRAVMQTPIARVATILVARRRIVLNGGVHVMSSLEDVLVLARPHKAAGINQQVLAAQTDGVACRIEQAVLNDDVARIETGNTIIAGLERAGANRDVIAVVDIEAVVTAQNAHALGEYVIA